MTGEIRNREKNTSRVMKNFENDYNKYVSLFLINGVSQQAYLCPTLSVLVAAASFVLIIIIY